MMFGFGFICSTSLFTCPSSAMETNLHFPKQKVLHLRSDWLHCKMELHCFQDRKSWRKNGPEDVWNLSCCTEVELGVLDDCGANVEVTTAVDGAEVEDTTSAEEIKEVEVESIASGHSERCNHFIYGTVKHPEQKTQRMAYCYDNAAVYFRLENVECLGFMNNSSFSCFSELSVLTIVTFSVITSTSARLFVFCTENGCVSIIIQDAYRKVLSVTGWSILVILAATVGIGASGTL